MNTTVSGFIPPPVTLKRLTSAPTRQRSRTKIFLTDSKAPEPRVCGIREFVMRTVMVLVRVWKGRIIIEQARDQFRHADFPVCHKPGVK